MAPHCSSPSSPTPFPEKSQTLSSQFSHSPLSTSQPQIIVLSPSAVSDSSLSLPDFDLFLPLSESWLCFDRNIVPAATRDLTPRQSGFIAVIKFVQGLLGRSDAEVVISIPREKPYRRVRSISIIIWLSSSPLFISCTLWTVHTMESSTHFAWEYFPGKLKFFVAKIFHSDFLICYFP